MASLHISWYSHEFVEAGTNKRTITTGYSFNATADFR